MKTILYVMCGCAFAYSTLLAQNVGNCTTGKAEQYLDINNVRARISNSGNIFGEYGYGIYEIPKGSGIHVMSFFNFMLGGYDKNNQLHITGSGYRASELWSGALDQNGEAPSDCKPYDRIYKISKADLEQYEKSGIASQDLAEWAYQLGAPVKDGDGNPHNYNLAGGDRPELIGDQMVWWVMNDLGNVHLATRYVESLPVALEVRTTAFAFNTPALQNTTFYRFKIKYRGKMPLSKVTMGVFADPDIGGDGDDYGNSDSTYSVASIYNSYEYDYEYGNAPPALSFVVFKSPFAINDQKDNDFDGEIDEPNEQLGMTSWYKPVENPSCGFSHSGNGKLLYNAFNGYCMDGTPLTMNGFGYSGIGKKTKFHYNGNPITKTGWSQENVDGKGGLSTNWQARFFLGISPFTLQPEEEVEMGLGIVWARSHSRHASLQKSWNLAKALSKAGDDLFTTDASGWDYLFENVNQDVAFESVFPRNSNSNLQPLILRQNAPNPAYGAVEIPFWLPYSDEVSLKVYDVLGREVATILEESREAGSHTAHFDTRKLPTSGVYLCRLHSKRFGLTASMRMSVVRD